VPDDIQPSKSELSRETIIKWLLGVGKALVANLLPLTTLTIIAGFFVINSYLARYTRLFTYNISASQYIAAGINLLLAILYYFFPIAAGSIVLALVLAIVFILWDKYLAKIWSNIKARFFSNLEKRTTSNSQNPLYRLWLLIKSALTTLWNLSNRAAWVLLGGAIILLSFIYGYGYYASSPRMLGGGQPADVILIFKDEIQPSEWSFAETTLNASQTPEFSKRSKKVKLLVELTDGILVQDEDAGVVAIVKNDVLNGIIEYKAATPTVTTTGTLSPTPSPTMTP
jgi:hypothetical protein